MFLFSQATAQQSPYAALTLTNAEAGYYPFFPSITRLNNGNLLMVYYWNTAHVNKTGGKIMAKISKDNGVSWSRPVPVADYTHQGLDSRDPNLSVLSNGIILLSFFTGKYDGSGFVSTEYQDRVVETRVMRCTDGTGLNWSEPVVVPTQKYSNATSGSIIETDAKVVLLPSYGRFAAKDVNKAYVSRSTDGGLTWQTDILVTDDNNNELGYNEMTLAYLNNVVYAVTRPSGRIFKSFDHGLNWQPHHVNGPPMHAPDLIKLDNNTLFLTWCSTGQIPENSSRAVFGKVFNPDIDWDDTPTYLIYSSNDCIDMGYPTSVQMGENIMTVYYDKCKGMLAASIIPMNAISTDEMPEFILFPNPATDFTNILSIHKELLILDYQLFNSSGMFVMQGRSNIIPLYDLEKGYYYLFTELGIQKILKQ